MPGRGEMRNTSRLRQLVGAAVLFASFMGVQVLRGDDPAALAKRILDDSVPDMDRRNAVANHPEVSVELVKEMVRDLESGTKEEYRRIPWIWRVTVAAGKRNQADEIRRVLDFCLPQIDGPLEDWRAVVIGGGIINGISLVGPWPGARINEIIGNDEALQARWQRSLTLAAKMADDEKVFKGTRYDALRMIALESWDLRGAQLFKYLVKGVDDELQQGAISGLADMPSPYAAQALLSGFDHYSEGNRKFALAALMRDEQRVQTLLDSVVSGQITAGRPEMATEIVREMVRDLKPGTKEEYRRIPWIWRVTVTAAKRNHADEIRRILDFCLPQPDGPLDDWRAVVIGGGIINGISLVGPWPGPRIDEIIGNDAALKSRWQRSLTLAAAMADDEKIFKGTRYDALRMIALDSWDLRGGQLFKYLMKGTDDELMQGAISGLADMPVPAAAQALLSGYAHYSPDNRKFALEALVRDESRAAVLLDAIESGRVSAEHLGDQAQKLVAQQNPELRERAKKLLTK